MTAKELIDRHNKINEFIFTSRLFEAFRELKSLAEEHRYSDYGLRLNAHQETYQNILKYSFEQGDDPEKERVFQRLVKSVLEFTDELTEALSEQFSLQAHYRLKKKTGTDEALDYDDIKEWTQSLILNQETGNSLPQDSGSEKSHDLFFRYFYFRNNLDDNDIALIEELKNEKHFPWYYKSLLVSALTLSSMRVFQAKKIEFLFSFYDKKEEQVWQRALTGLLLVLYLHQERIGYYPELTDRIKIMETDSQWNKSIEIILIQLLRAKDTEKLTEKLQKEILPELWKIRSKLEDKLNIEDLLKDKMLEDKNPEWERVFEDTPGLYDKIEEFSNLQMEGSDVFLSAFSMLKRFPFFSPMSHWLLPFFRENPDFAEVFQDVNKEGFNSQDFFEGMEKSSFLCNSDKYSFCLNIKHMPPMQKSAMAELFQMEMQAMNEMKAEEDLVKQNVKNRAIIVQYIQDLYRFFTLFPYKNEFTNVFNLSLDFHNHDFFHDMVEEKEIIRNIAEFYFSKDHYKEALEVFHRIEDEEGSPELFEKIGYAYQCTGNYPQALENYHKAEILAEPRTWLFNKIAFCNRKLDRLDDALHYYHESEKLDGENLYIQTSLGQVHMDKKEYEEALKYFFKVEYLAPENIRIHRPIAWCSFVLGKLDNAQKYLEKIIEKEANKFDFMNLGHVYWCKNDKAGAIGMYRKSYEKSRQDKNWFSNTMIEDGEFLNSCGISDFDISLMIDYIKMNARLDQP